MFTHYLSSFYFAFFHELLNVAALESTCFISCHGKLFIYLCIHLFVFVYLFVYLYVHLCIHLSSGEIKTKALCPEKATKAYEAKCSTVHAIA